MMRKMLLNLRVRAEGASAQTEDLTDVVSWCWWSKGRSQHPHVCARLGSITHKRTRPYRPQTNGKVERVNGTRGEEWAYARAYLSKAEPVAAYPRQTVANSAAVEAPHPQRRGSSRQMIPMKARPITSKGFGWGRPMMKRW